MADTTTVRDGTTVTTVTTTTGATVAPAAAAPAAGEGAFLTSLYDSAGRLQIELEPSLRDADFALTPAHIGAFNQILADARRAVPDSIALRDDVAEIDAADPPLPRDVHHALRTTIVPTLHNALPPDAYRERG
jgi:hypothetical protein